MSFPTYFLTLTKQTKIQKDSLSLQKYNKEYLMRPDNDWNQRLGVVYSTNPDFNYSKEETVEEETLEPSRQRLTVTIDRRNRGGKQVTLVSGFVGTQEDLAALGKILKVKCGVGGSAKDGEITIQGDLRDKVTSLLKDLGYNAKRGN